MAYLIWHQRGRCATCCCSCSSFRCSCYIVKIYTMRSILGLQGFLNQGLVAVGILDNPACCFFTTVLDAADHGGHLSAVCDAADFFSLERIPQNIVQASADLGGRRPDFPACDPSLSAPGTVAGALFVFVLALGDHHAADGQQSSGFTIGG